jgi:hypothetical protein
VNLYLALVEEYRCLRVLILRVDRRNLFVYSRLADPGHAQHTSQHANVPGASFQLRLHVVLKHRPHFARWPRQQHDGDTLVIDEHAGRAAVRIRKHLGAIDNHRLT